MKYFLERFYGLGTVVKIGAVLYAVFSAFVVGEGIGYILFGKYMWVRAGILVVVMAMCFVIGALINSD